MNSDKPSILIFEWDRKKAEKNIRRHQIPFEEAKTVFNDPFLLTYGDEFHSSEENRCISIGKSAAGRTLIVVHTERIDPENIIIRIISCRKTTGSERKAYEEAP
jgi:hypothetical protein